YKEYTYFKEGDVLFAKITPCMENGKSAVACNLKNEVGFGSTEFHVLRPKEGVLSEFIFYFIRKKRFRNLAKLHFTGTVGHKRVPKEFLINSKIPIPFRNGKPDLETQKKIVEYIEANFSRIDKILEKKKKELEQLDELWESVLEQAFKPKEGEEWREVKLSEILYIESGSRPKGGVKKYTNGVPSIGGEHLNYNGAFSFEKLKYVPNDFYEQSNKGKIQKQDILIVKVGATTGKTAFIDNNFPFEKAIVNENVFLCRIIKEKVYPKFVYRFLMSREGQNRILKTKSETAQESINKRFSKLVKTPIPFRKNLPDLEKQREIANHLDSVYEKIKALKEKIQKQITQLEEMKESILDGVFSHEKAK
ncbi:restriction endonuclease subunit S, partial [Peptococcaceae bacterium]|nr:restriction endonuclease subunit S [Peptococcaceae bacterium]